MSKIELIQGDCLEVMKELDDNSVDAIVTDPPYGLGFMGKKWDELPPGKDVFEQCLRVLKPGGHLLSFGGTRTYHRMTVAIEDAGFEVRDMIEWVYGSGFPKSHNIGKAVDKLQGNERAVVGKWQPMGTARYVGGKNPDGIFTDPDKAELKGELELTKGTSQWEGWGTALKPAHEPICMAMKPREGTFAENCLKWGVGGINIDESRVDLIGIEEHKTEGKSGLGNNVFGKYENKPKKLTDLPRYNAQGRFPANLLLGADENGVHEEVRECFPETGKGGYPKLTKDFTGKSNITFRGAEEREERINLDSGNASRYFKSIKYCPKASKSERNKGCEDVDPKKMDKNRKEGNPGGDNPRNRGVKKRKNYHPTVKPIELMEYLINMVTREGQTVLDPFMGSGTTGVACKKLGRDFIGIELNEDYIKIAEARINDIQKIVDANEKLVKELKDAKD